MGRWLVRIERNRAQVPWQKLSKISQTKPSGLLDQVLDEGEYEAKDWKEVQRSESSSSDATEQVAWTVVRPIVQSWRILDCF